MNTAQPAPEGATEPHGLPDSFYQDAADKCVNYAISLPKGIARGIAGTVIEEACIKHAAALRARCERLEEALQGATDFIRNHAEPFKAGWILRDATLSACDTALAQPEDGK